MTQSLTSKTASHNSGRSISPSDWFAQFYLIRDLSLRCVCYPTVGITDTPETPETHLRSLSTTSSSQVCLLSHCGDGLALSDYQRLKTQFVQAYGFQHLVTWNNLLKVGDPIYEVTNPIWRIDGIAFFFFRSGWLEWRVVLKAVKLRAGTSGSGWQWYWEIFPFTFINCINFTLGWGC